MESLCWNTKVILNISDNESFSCYTHLNYTDVSIDDSVLKTHIDKNKTLLISSTVKNV